MVVDMSVSDNVCVQIVSYLLKDFKMSGDPYSKFDIEGMAFDLTYQGVTDIKRFDGEAFTRLLDDYCLQD